MRTLICEGIGAFIVVEGWHLFLAVEVFSYRNPLESSQTWWTRHFLIEKIFINTHIFRNPLCAKIPFILGSKCVSQVFQHCSGVSWALVLYQPMDCGIVRPISWRSINLEFYPLQLPPHPIGPSLSSGRTCGVTIQDSRDDGSRFKIRELCPPLTGCPEAIMTHDTCHSSIGYYLRSKCRFVFHWILSHSSFLISLFFAETHCRSTSVVLVRDHSV